MNSIKKYTLYVDGACSGNPGPAGIGAVVYLEEKVVTEISRPIGDATNNIAEYTALICGLEELLVLKATHIEIFSDSELVYKQVTGQYKVKNEKLKALCMQAQRLLQGFESVNFQHILREKNKVADKLATSAIQKKQTEMVAPLFIDSEEESPSSKG